MCKAPMGLSLNCPRRGWGGSALRRDFDRFFFCPVYAPLPPVRQNIDMYITEVSNVIR